MRKLFPAFCLLFAACANNTPGDVRTDSHRIDSVAAVHDSILRNKQADLLDTVQVESNATLIRETDARIAEAIEKNTPQGWTFMDTMTGDLNRDKYTDMLLVLEENGDSETVVHNRALIILTGNAKGELEFRERNDTAVLCRECGGIFGDPYDGLAIKNGYFSVQHYGGSAWRWTRIITFRYHEKEKDWFLHKDGGVSYYIYDESEDADSTYTESFQNQKLYGVQKFTDFSNEQ